MSRVGRRPIDLPAGIKVEVAKNIVKVEGKGNTPEHMLPEDFKGEVEGNTVTVLRPSDSRLHKELHGTTRSLIQNMVTGLSAGFQKKLQIQGVGYKAQIKGKMLVLDIGFSHSVNYTPPEDVIVEATTPTEILVKGVDRQKVGKVAAEIRAY